MRAAGPCRWRSASRRAACRTPHLADAIASLLATAGVEACWLAVEITESASMAHPQAVIATLAGLRAMGVRVAIDDVGTSSSWLSYLQQLPVDELKIDRSFVRSIAVDEAQATIVRPTIDLGHTLGLLAVAEGSRTSIPGRRRPVAATWPRATTQAARRRARR